MTRTALRVLAISLCILCAGALFGDGSLLTVSGPLASKLSSTLGISRVGTTLYKTQEGVHSAITSTTGIAIPHSYVTVTVGDADIPVDPWKVGN